MRALRGLLVRDGIETAYDLTHHLSALCEAVGTVSDVRAGVRAIIRQTISR